MSYYDEDFYYDPSEFDSQVEEFKTALASSVQQKYLDEMAELRAENESLREFRDKRDEYECKLNRAKQEYQQKMRDAERQANKQRLKDLLSFFSVVGYRVKREYMQGPKCDRCDENREIHFVSPLGREMKEKCTCAAGTTTRRPKQVNLMSFYAAKGLSNDYFERSNENRDYDRYDLCARLYDKDKPPFEIINEYTVVFLKEEDCQAYCDWLNKQEAKHDE